MNTISDYIQPYGSILFKAVLFLILVQNVNAQQFNLKGSAVQLNTNTYRLTQALNNQAGMATNYYPLDLTTNFSLNFELNFGNLNNNGADGFAFTLTRECDPSLQAGEGLGVLNTPNSIVVEFDTWNNGFSRDDNANDHTGIYADGNLSPAGRLYVPSGTTPPCLSPSCLNIEDGQWYAIEIKWIYDSATSQTIEVYFGGVLRVSATDNHISNRFLGSNRVFWSVSAATGGAVNLHQFRVPDENNTFTLGGCGETVTLAAPTLGINYSWTNHDSTSPTATYTFYEDQVITCNYTNFCGDSESVSFIIDVEEVTPVFSDFDLPDTICQGDTINLPTISNNGITGTWSPAFNTNATTTYTFTPDPNQCAVVPNSHTINVLPQPVTEEIDY